MATETAIDVVMPQMGVSVSEGTVTPLAEAGGRAHRGGRAAARDLDRQGRHRGAEPRIGHADADPRPGGRDGRGRHAAGADRRCGAPAAPESTAPAAPAQRRRPSPPLPSPVAAGRSLPGSSRGERQGIRLPGGGAHRLRARRRPRPGAGHRPRRPRDEGGHSRLRGVRRRLRLRRSYGASGAENPKSRLPAHPSRRRRRRRRRLRLASYSPAAGLPGRPSSP